MRASFIVIALLFSACAADFQVAGPFARSISESDIAALRQLTESGRYQSITIKAIGPDRVKLETARTVGNEAHYGDLDAIRRNGKWTLVKLPALPPSQKSILLY